MPESRMATPIAVSFGFVMAGMMTKQPIAMRKTYGMMMLTLIGRGMLGLVLRSHSIPTTEAPTDNQSV